MASKKTDAGRPTEVKKASSKTIPAEKERLDQLVDMVVATAQVKGWFSDIDAKDDKTFRYATISVERNGITGTFEIICDARVKITYHKTSFHSYGLADLYDAIRNEFYKLNWIERSDAQTEQQGSADVALLERVLRRFHRLARQLKHRHDDRQGFEINDEYDVQDLFHSVLRGLFDDVRAEEYTPSYAGGSSRMDFLLKRQQIVIEIKLASATLRDKQIGEQLLIDIGRYKSHPDCHRLVCFVYDPLGYVKNPAGLEADLTQPLEKFEVKVIVVST